MMMIIWDSKRMLTFPTDALTLYGLWLILYLMFFFVLFFLFTNSFQIKSIINCDSDTSLSRIMESSHSVSLMFERAFFGCFGMGRMGFVGLYRAQYTEVHTVLRLLFSG